MYIVCGKGEGGRKKNVIFTIRKILIKQQLGRRRRRYNISSNTNLR
jgi:hypothetical protein